MDQPPAEENPAQPSESLSASPSKPARATLERDLGDQPLAALMAERDLKPADLVSASTEQITHKMVTRALKGRRLTSKTMEKIVRAWNRATESTCTRSDLFNYRP